jgi:alkanesulfonate monooxygenase SsuD/methylene tetrahydromethanopterin reductase-like flavin-dependent oxidoreductase (luciferase family)
MLRIACTHAQEWNTWGAPDLAGTVRAKFVDACEAVGTDPTSMHTTVQALVLMTDDQEKIDAAYAGPMGDRMIAGTDDRIVDEFGRYVELGFDEFIMFDGTLGATPAERLESYRRFHTDIASKV